MSEHNFKRTECACKDCTACCKRQPGPLAPGDFERIAEFLGETKEVAKRHFWASPGCLLRGTDGETIRVGSITPQRRKGRCVFLDENDRCKIHAVAPFGCAYFDTHMSSVTAHPRSVWLALEQKGSPEYQRLRNMLPYATSYKPAAY